MSIGKIFCLINTIKILDVVLKQVSLFRAVYHTHYIKRDWTWKKCKPSLVQIDGPFN